MKKLFGYTLSLGWVFQTLLIPLAHGMDKSGEELAGPSQTAVVDRSSAKEERGAVVGAAMLKHKKSPIEIPEIADHILGFLNVEEDLYPLMVFLENDQFPGTYQQGVTSTLFYKAFYGVLFEKISIPVFIENLLDPATQPKIERILKRATYFVPSPRLKVRGILPPDKVGPLRDYLTTLKSRVVSAITTDVDISINSLFHHQHQAEADIHQRTQSMRQFLCVNPLRDVELRVNNLMGALHEWIPPVLDHNRSTLRDLTLLLHVPIEEEDSLFNAIEMLPSLSSLTLAGVRLIDPRLIRPTLESLSIMSSFQDLNQSATVPQETLDAINSLQSLKFLNLRRVVVDFDQIKRTLKHLETLVIHMDPSKEAVGKALRLLREIVEETPGTTLPLKTLAFPCSHLVAEDVGNLVQVVNASPRLRKLDLGDVNADNLSIETFEQLGSSIATSKINTLGLRLAFTPAVMESLIKILKYSNIINLSLEQSTLVDNDAWATFDWSPFFRDGYRELNIKGLSYHAELHSMTTTMGNLLKAAKAQGLLESLHMDFDDIKIIRNLLEGHPSLRKFTTINNPFKPVRALVFKDTFDPHMIPGWVAEIGSSYVEAGGKYVVSAMRFSRLNPDELPFVPRPKRTPIMEVTGGDETGGSTSGTSSE